MVGKIVTAHRSYSDAFGKQITVYGTVIKEYDNYVLCSMSGGLYKECFDKGRAK